MSAMAEARARAFAAEFLLPRRVAGARMAVTQDPPRTLRGLQASFGVSAEVVAWQARNGEVSLPPDVLQFLRTRVSRPDNF